MSKALHKTSKTLQFKHSHLYIFKHDPGLFFPEITVVIWTHSRQIFPSISFEFKIRVNPDLCDLPRRSLYSWYFWKKTGWRGLNSSVPTQPQPTQTMFPLHDSIERRRVVKKKMEGGRGRVRTPPRRRRHHRRLIGYKALPPLVFPSPPPAALAETRNPSPR